jgi:hypothetical protein
VVALNQPVVAMQEMFVQCGSGWAMLVLMWLACDFERYKAIHPILLEFAEGKGTMLRPNTKGLEILGSTRWLDDFASELTTSWVQQYGLNDKMGEATEHPISQQEARWPWYFLETSYYAALALDCSGTKKGPASSNVSAYFAFQYHPSSEAR